MIINTLTCLKMLCINQFVYKVSGLTFTKTVYIFQLNRLDSVKEQTKYTVYSMEMYSHLYLCYIRKDSPDFPLLV